LEFPVVILANLSVQFNTNDLYAPVICHKELGIGMDLVDNENRTKMDSPAKLAIRSRCLQDMVSESMRLLYVGMTRAKERLIMYYSAKDVDSQLADICYMDNLDCSQQIIENASCMGKWVLLSALRRTESGQLFAVAGPNRNAKVSRLPWTVTLQSVDAVNGEMSMEEMAFDDSPLTKYLQRTSYVYPYGKATQTPSKRTATQLKGRVKDTESAENTAYTPWQGASGADYGTAVHKVMQMLHYGKTETFEQIQDQLVNMQDKGLLTGEMAKLIDINAICRFFATDVGRNLKCHTNVLREFKFSILVDGEQFDPDLVGEQILLQGVVDCAMVDDDGITVIDFKTDRVTEDTVQNVARGYEQQVRAYAEAVSRIYGKPIKQALLYFFRLDRFVEVL
jgi:ATP-dependent helicase/nuclease subunit A